MKKKITAVLTFILAAALLAAPALATDFTIKDYDLSFSLPDDWYVITPDTPDDDPIFTSINSDPDALRERMTNENIYVFAFKPNSPIVLYVTASEDEASRSVFTYTKYSEEELNELAIKTLDEMEAVDDMKTRTGYGVYMRNGIRYIVLCYWHFSNDDLIHYQEFRTIYNGKNVSVVMAGVEQKIQEENSDTQSYVVDHLRFTKTLKDPTAGVSGGEKGLANYALVIVCAVGLVGVLIWSLVDAAKKKKRAAAAAAEPDEKPDDSGGE